MHPVLRKIFAPFKALPPDKEILARVETPRAPMGPVLVQREGPRGANVFYLTIYDGNRKR